MSISHQQNVREFHNIKITNKSFENIAKFRYGNVTYKELYVQIKVGEYLLPSLSSHQLSKNIQIKMYETLIYLWVPHTEARM
jgi:hypothetical protein